MFWIRQISDQSIKMCPKAHVNLCQEYNEKLSCDGTCDKLHLCKKFLWSNTSCMDAESCQFEHNLNSQHNDPILEKAIPNGYTDKMKMKVLRNSFPRVCKSFLQDGSCDQPFCGYYHMCQKSIIGKCRKNCMVAERIGESIKSMHSFTLLSHNHQVSKTFFPIDQDASRKLVKPNLLTKEMEVQEDLSSQQQSFESNLFNCKLQCSKLCLRPISVCLFCLQFNKF